MRFLLRPTDVSTLYPESVDSWNLHPDNYTPEWLDRARDTGFDSIECGFEVLDKTRRCEVDFGLWRASSLSRHQSRRDPRGRHAHGGTAWTGEPRKAHARRGIRRACRRRSG